MGRGQTASPKTGFSAVCWEEVGDWGRGESVKTAFQISPAAHLAFTGVSCFGFTDLKISLEFSYPDMSHRDSKWEVWNVPLTGRRLGLAPGGVWLDPLLLDTRY